MAVVAMPEFSNESSTIPVFPGGALAVTPSDVDTFERAATIYVGVAGNVAILPANGGSAVTFVAVPAGSVVPCRALAVLATGTTATTMVAVY